MPNSNHTFPECVYLGEYQSQQYEDFPAYLPACQGGFCLHYQTGEETSANRHIENAVLCLLEDLPAKLLSIDIFDFANRPNFPFLNQLKNDGLCHIALNEPATTTAFNRLESLIQHRYHNLFNSDETHLNQYNQRSPRPEPFHVVIIQTDSFPSASLSPQRLQNFLKTAYDAGIYVIALHNPSALSADSDNPALAALLQTLPSVQVAGQTLIMDESTLPVKKLAQFGYTFTPADVNQDQIISTLKAQLHDDATSDDFPDFLTIPIGEYPNGETAYFSLGETSKDFSAILLGTTGTGKSTLMNNIIMQIGERYDASQIRLYLMDYKKGVEFNKFKNHPNVEKIFLKSQDINAGIALLAQVQQTIEDRYELFTHQQVENINDYNRGNPNAPLAHLIVMIDEFHKLLRGDYRHEERVNGLLETLAKEGRAAGVHLILSTQSLKGVALHDDSAEQMGLRMTYRVVNENALGYNVFASEHTKQILNLAKYQVFVQPTLAQAYTVLVHKPEDIEHTIKRLRLSRPAHLQVQAEIIESQAPAPVATEQPTPPPSEPVINPNAERLSELDKRLAEANAKLQALQQADNSDGDDDMPDWLKNLSDSE